MSILGMNVSDARSMAEARAFFECERLASISLNFESVEQSAYDAVVSIAFLMTLEQKGVVDRWAGRGAAARPIGEVSDLVLSRCASDGLTIVDHAGPLALAGFEAARAYVSGLDAADIRTALRSKLTLARKLTRAIVKRRDSVLKLVNMSEDDAEAGYFELVSDMFGGTLAGLEASLSTAVR